MRLNIEKMSFLNEKSIGWIIWSIAGLYYFFEIILRMLPGTMTSELMGVFHINATQLGVFTAFYYWSYTTMQIPAGLIVDRFSIHKTLFYACLFCLIGFAVVHATNDIYIAEFGRFIVGFGSAFAYVSALKVAALWLPQNRFGLASCIIDSLGMIGAMFTEIVLVRINVTRGYQTSVMLLLIMGLIVAFLIFFIFRDLPSPKKSVEESVLQRLKMIIKNPQIWLIGLVGCLTYLPCSVIGDVWGIPYLKDVYHLSREQSASLLATFFAGWIILGPFLGAISDKIQRRCLPTNLSILTSAVLFSLIIFLPYFDYIMPISALYLLFFSIGIAMGTHPLVFAIAKENYSIKMAGTVVAFTNTLIMLGGLIFQPLVGLLLDVNHGSLHSIGAQYSMMDYTIALALIPLSLLVSLILMCFIRETGFATAKEKLLGLSNTNHDLTTF